MQAKRAGCGAAGAILLFSAQQRPIGHLGKAFYLFVRPAKYRSVTPPGREPAPGINPSNAIKKRNVTIKIVTFLFYKIRAPGPCRKGPFFGSARDQHPVWCREASSASRSFPKLARESSLRADRMVTTGSKTCMPFMLSSSACI